MVLGAIVAWVVPTLVLSSSDANLLVGIAAISLSSLVLAVWCGYRYAAALAPLLVFPVIAAAGLGIVVIAGIAFMLAALLGSFGSSV